MYNAPILHRERETYLPERRMARSIPQHMPRAESFGTSAQGYRWGARGRPPRQSSEDWHAAHFKEPLLEEVAKEAPRLAARGTLRWLCTQAKGSSLSVVSAAASSMVEKLRKCEGRWIWW